MWQRFTERARQAISYGLEEAIAAGEEKVSTEHLLLGLLREKDTVAAHVLDRLGVGSESIRSKIAHGKPGQDDPMDAETHLASNVPLTPRVESVIGLAYAEARGLNDHFIGTEHLLLGLVRDGDRPAARVLAKHGVDLERTRRQILLLQGNSDAGRLDAGPRRRREEYYIEGLVTELSDYGGQAPGDFAVDNLVHALVHLALHEANQLLVIASTVGSNPSSCFVRDQSPSILLGKNLHEALVGQLAVWAEIGEVAAGQAYAKTRSVKSNGKSYEVSIGLTPVEQGHHIELSARPTDGETEIAEPE